MENARRTKILLAALITGMSEIFGTFGVLISILTVIFVLDWLTGIGAAISDNAKVRTDSEGKKHGFQSIIGVIGIMKKVGYMVTIALSCLLDLFLHVTTEYLQVKMPFRLFFGTIVCTWFILNEMISVLENLDRSGVELPAFLRKAIEVLKINIDKQGNNAVNNLEKEIEKE